MNSWNDSTTTVKEIKISVPYRFHKQWNVQNVEETGKSVLNHGLWQDFEKECKNF
jgi:hypothetical protein